MERPHAREAHTRHRRQDSVPECWAPSSGVLCPPGLEWDHLQTSTVTQKCPGGKGGGRGTSEGQSSFLNLHVSSHILIPVKIETHTKYYFGFV